MSFFVISDGKTFKKFGRPKITKERLKVIGVKIQVEWVLILPQA